MSEARLDAYRGKAAGVLALIFLIGGVSGALSIKLYERQAGSAIEAAPVGHLNDPALAVEYLQEELELNSGQVDQVQAILDECIMVEADLLTQVRAIQEEGRQRILIVLDHGQRQKFEAVLLEVSNR